MKKVVSFFLALILAILMLPVSAAATSAAEGVSYTLLDDYAFDYTMNAGDTRILWDNFTDSESLSRGYIDLSELEIPYTPQNLYALKAMLDSILYTNLYTDLFFPGKDFVTGVMFTPENPEEIRAAWLVLDMMADKVNAVPGLTEEQKVWLLQDELVSKVSYAKGEYGGQTVIEAMLENICVCAGYAKTLTVLCRKCGIECYYMTGDGTVDHAWCIVRVNGKLYYADPTWDDNDNKAIIGYVKHKYLLSSAELFDHSQYKFDKIPEDDTSFDKAEWKNSNTKALYFKGDIYYVDLYLQANVYRLHRVGDPDFEISLNNSYADLLSDGESIIVSQKKAIYKVDLENMKLGKCLYNLSDEDKEAGLGIFGMKLEDGKFIMDLAKSSLYVISASTEMTRREAEYTGYVADTRCKITAENTCSDTLSLKIGFSGRGKTEGYYFGKNSQMAENTYYSLSEGEHTAENTVTEPGTYYLWAKDANGEFSAPETITAVRTDVNVPGGNSYTTLNLKGEGFFPEQYVYGDSVHFAARFSGNAGTLKKVEHNYLYYPEKDGTLTASERSGLVYGTTRYSLEKADLTQFIRWEFDTDSTEAVLKLTGKGRTGTFIVNHPAPWYEYRTAVKKIVIGDGITILGTQCFKDFTKVETVTLPKTLTEVYQSAFKNLKELKTVEYSGTEETWSAVIWDERGGNDPIFAAQLKFVPDVLKGDINGDGKINASDMAILKKVIVGAFMKTDAADVDGDCKVSAPDAVLLKKKIVGKA